MNMKKTIAAVAASAVAVSAMATSVSAIDVLEHGTSDLAFEAQTVHYNLVKEVKEYEPTVVLTATYESVNVELNKQLNFSIVNVQDAALNNLITAVKDVTITGTYVDTNGANVGAVKPIIYSTDEGSDNYYKTLADNNAAPATVGQFGIKCGPNTIVSAGTTAAGATQARLTVAYTVKLNPDYAKLLDDGMKVINNALALNNAGGVEVKLVHTDVPAGIPGTTTASKYDKGEKTNYYPFKTGLNDGIDGRITQDVMTYLSDTMKYVNNKAVINDLIANYDEVTFKFNTAVKPVKNDKYDDDGDKIYTSFSQHLYNLYGAEYKENLQNTGYINYNWTGYNLFAGALIINHDLSMSLNDATIFDYGETSLSFNWADLNNGAAYNPYVNYVQSIKLATSRDWYWDSLDITGAIVESDQAATNEGTEAEEETIGEDEEASEEEELGEEEETEEEPAVEEEAAAPAENPATGNAPIALAVIPVALAAAAVVAKKRG